MTLQLPKIKGPWTHFLPVMETRHSGNHWRRMFLNRDDHGMLANPGFGVRPKIIPLVINQGCPEGRNATNQKGTSILMASVACVSGESDS